MEIVHYDCEVRDVEECHEKFSLPLGKDGPKFMEDEFLLHRINFLKEELEEFMEAVQNKDLPKAVDGLVDLVYVVKGTALMMGVDPVCWAHLWEEVHAANMRKEKTEPVSARERYHFGLRKPEGWKPPDIAGILKRHKALLP